MLIRAATPLDSLESLRSIVRPGADSTPKSVAPFVDGRDELSPTRFLWKRRRRPPRDGYVRGNSRAAAIILNNAERFTGLCLEWAKLYTANNPAEVKAAIRRFHQGQLRGTSEKVTMSR